MSHIRPSRQVGRCETDNPETATAIMTKLCVPLTAGTCQEMAHQIDAAAEVGAEMIELRLDYLAEWSMESIRDLMLKARQFHGEVIATCRIAEEGGRYDADESSRISLLELVGLGGADYIDVELQAWRASANVRQKIGLVCEVDATTDRPRRKLILSKHDFQRTPKDLPNLVAEIRREPCHIAKVACKAEAVTDALRMLDVLHDAPDPSRTIALSMGEAGIMTRVLAKKLGGLLTFASLEAGKESAPGQPTIQDMRGLYRWDSLGAATKVFGVIGCPVAHSMSPAIHNAAFERIGFDGVYLPFRVEPDYASLAAFIDGCLARPWLDVRGFSVTIPHKENLLRYVQERGGDIEPLAHRIGVANTLVIEHGDKLSTCNTDYRGALDALCAGLECDASALKGTPIAVLGAGGAARALVAGLCDAGAAVTIYNRTADKARALADEFGANAKPWEQRTQLDADVLVHCTTLGMWPNVADTPIPAESLPPSLAVFDTVYNPVETRLLRDARNRGCRTIDGVAMFVNQAVAQFQRWTARPAPADLMRDVVIRTLGP